MRMMILWLLSAIYLLLCVSIAGARQIFRKNFFFFPLPGKFSLEKKKKKVFMKNLPGVSNINFYYYE
jgi:hypothetical protein